MSKKTVSLVLVLALALTLLAGCGTVGTVQNDNVGGNVAATDPSKAQITVATWDGGLGSQWLENAAAEFEALYSHCGGAALADGSGHDLRCQQHRSLRLYLS